MGKKIGIVFILLLMSLGFIFLVPEVLKAQGEDNEVKEILITVKPRIIVLPKDATYRLSLSAARIRSTELRNTNKEYNAITIEAVCELVEKKTKDAENTLVSEEKKNRKVGRATKIRKLLKKQKDETMEMIPVKDTYIIQFADFIDEEGNKKTVSLNSAVSAYQALEVVVSAGWVDEKDIEAEIAESGSENTIPKPAEKKEADKKSRGKPGGK